MPAPPDPPIDGLEEAGYLTNETVFNLTERPRRLLVIGGGPLGLRVGAGVRTARLRGDHRAREPYFLPGEERDAAEILADALRRDGIEVRLNTEVASVARGNRAKARATSATTTRTRRSTVDEILVGVGRVPNVEGLNLEAAGVEYDRERGVGSTILCRPPTGGSTPPAMSRCEHEIHPHGGRHGAHRDPERAVLGPQELSSL